MRDKWHAFLRVLGIAILAIATIAIFSGSDPDYIRQRYLSSSQISEYQFCWELAKSVSGTVKYKEGIYQSCIGD